MLSRPQPERPVSPQTTSRVVATYTVPNELTAEFELDTTGMDPDLIAIWLTEDAPADDRTHCPNCGARPQERRVARFTVKDITYHLDLETGHWTPADSTSHG